MKAAWTRFWFTAEPGWHIWVYRFGLCAWLAAFFVARVPYVDELYGDSPVRRSSTLLQWLGAPILPLWGVKLLFVALFVLLLTFAVSSGRGARVVHVLLFVIVLYLFGFDPSTSRAYGYLAQIQLGLLWLTPYDRSPMATLPRWGKQLLKVQFATVYGFTVLAKVVQGHGWLDGENLYWNLLSQRFGRYLLSDWIAITPGLALWLTWLVLATEQFVAIGLWFRPTRRLAILACAGLHLGMALSLRVSLLFHSLMVLHLVLFLAVTPRSDRTG